MGFQRASSPLAAQTASLCSAISSIASSVAIAPEETIVAPVNFRSFVQPRSRSAADKESELTSTRPTNLMHPTLLTNASAMIPNQHLLVNIVRLRVRQLIRGHRPLIAAPPGMGFADLALSELIAGKLSYEAVPGVIPDNSFVPIVTFPGARPEKKAA
jgi:DNA-directed RNA polymerase subunit omega